MGMKAPDKISFERLSASLQELVEIARHSASPTIMRRIRSALQAHATATELARAAVDPIAVPRGSFDPADPKVVGRMVALALIAQHRVPLRSVAPTYGSGVYAIYYNGDHPLYERISGTETPIYVGKADPADREASTPREQGSKLTSRLLEHAGTIATVEDYFDQTNPPHVAAIRLDDFTCRRLVCATNAQLVAEKQLIAKFWPIWNADTKACWGMSKHGDSAKTRANKRSPWDVVHPGRQWALDDSLVDSLTESEVEERISETLARVPPTKDHAALVEEMLDAFRQHNLADGSGPLIPPVGTEAEGPSEDEAGSEES
jgi:hypothetical protein